MRCSERENESHGGEVSIRAWISQRGGRVWTERASCGGDTRFFSRAWPSTSSTTPLNAEINNESSTRINRGHHGQQQKQTKRRTQFDRKANQRSRKIVLLQPWLVVVSFHYLSWRFISSSVHETERREHRQEKNGTTIPRPARRVIFCTNRE